MIDTSTTVNRIAEERSEHRIAWVIVQPIINRNAVVANVPCDGWKRTAATALRLGRFGGR